MSRPKRSVTKRFLLLRVNTDGAAPWSFHSVDRTHRRVYTDSGVAGVRGRARRARGHARRGARPSEPPAVRGGGDGGDDESGGDGDSRDGVRYVAPRDAEAGGSWIGLSERGLVVAVTNRWTDADREGERSRGPLVRDCLTADSAESAVRAVERDLDERAYAGFNLVLADARGAFLLAYDGGLAVTRLDPGVHVVGNVGGVIDGGERFAIPERRAEFGAERADSARRIAAALVPEPR